MVVSYGTIDRDYAQRLATTPAEDDGPVWMINLMKYKAIAEYADAPGSEITGREADDRYAPLDILEDIGAEVVFVADVDTQFFNSEPAWDRVAIVKYPTRRSFIEMQSRPDFKERHVHKEAGMQETIVCGGVPIPSPQNTLGLDSAPDWSEVPHPPTDDDPPVEVLHLIRFREAESITEMATYTDHAMNVAVPNGVRVAAWFGIEGTIVGDGRRWDQARFNNFPSKAAFMAVALDPDRLAAQSEHREVAIADTYTMILRASVDRIAESVAASR